MALERWRPDAGFWGDRSVAVTGATGFLGAHVVNLLCEMRASVVALVRDRTPRSPLLDGSWPEVTVVEGDLVDRDCLERMLGEYEVRTVIHLAAQSQVGVANANPISTFEANTRGTWQLLEAVRRSSSVTETLVASTDKAYGSQPTLPYTEDMPLRAVHPYDVSKACADMVSRCYATTYDVPLVVTRCGNLYGGGDTNWQRLIPGTIRSVLRGERPVLRSGGRMVRDWLYAPDAAEAYLRLAEGLAEHPRLAGEAFNLSTGERVDVLGVVAAIQAAAGTDLEPDVRSTAVHEIDEQHLDSEKVRRELGWAPTHDLEAGLAEAVSWYREHLAGSAAPR
jgi:CDP-glucose 4,6-dehydratase